jgi:Ca2+-binding EF-hand superfamily protein
LPFVPVLVRKYDRPGAGGAVRDGRLTPAELGCAEETVRRFDANGDGGLDEDELRALLGQPVPDVELNVVIERTGRDAARITPTGTPRYPVAVPPQPKGATPATALVVDLGGTTLEFVIDDVLPSGNQVLIRQFDMADGDKNGYLDKSESTQGAAVLLQRVFALADRDGDGKLFRKELEAYIERQADAVGSRMLLSIADRGQPLFDMLDSDVDRKLSVRELRQTRGILAGLDHDGDGRIGQKEMPRRYRLGIGRGQSAAPRVVTFPAYDPSEPPRFRGGPEWFARMDRNGDGDVSRREFLGSRAEFRRFDRDGDGLIDPREARGNP